MNLFKKGHNPFRLRTPHNRVEFIEAANAAKIALLLDDARTYGLIDGCGTVNRDRATDFITRANQLGLTPNTIFPPTTTTNPKT